MEDGIHEIIGIFYEKITFHPPLELFFHGVVEKAYYFMDFFRKRMEIIWT